MPKAPLTGSRIRTARVDRGVRQAELARRCDISASYLNLIEHNRRRIGGALLNRIADALAMDVAQLSEGAERALASSVETAAMRHAEVEAEMDRLDEFAGRFPGIARLVAVQHGEVERLERVIAGLTERLTHDPFLSASLHEVLSSVTSIRSASSILADGGEIAPEWQARFSRNVFEDAQRLAEAAEQLVTYLDAGADIERGINLPQEDVDAWFDARGWRVAELEGDPTVDVEDMLRDISLSSPAATKLASKALKRYAADARQVPEAELLSVVAEGMDPAGLAQRFGCSLPVIFRRLASLPPDAFPDRQARGLVACDGSGTLIARKTVVGFDVPKYGAACPHWPLFQSLQRPHQPVRQSLRFNSREELKFDAWAFAETQFPGGYDRASVTEAWMLVVPKLGGAAGTPELGVGSSCRVCSERDCVARREPSMTAIVPSEGATS